MNAQKELPQPDYLVVTYPGTPLSINKVLKYRPGMPHVFNDVSMSSIMRLEERASLITGDTRIIKGVTCDCKYIFI